MIFYNYIYIISIEIINLVKLYVSLMKKILNFNMRNKILIVRFGLKYLIYVLCCE